MERIWRRFYKVDESRNRSQGGTGIGLAFVKAIMTNYDMKYGVINCDNGVEFYFDLNKAYLNMFVLLDFDVVIEFLLNLIFVKHEEIYKIVVLQLV